MASIIKNYRDRDDFSYEVKLGIPGRHDRMAELSSYKARKRGFTSSGEPEELIENSLENRIDELSTRAGKK